MSDLAGIAQRFNLSPDKVGKLGGIAKYAGELSSRIGDSRPKGDPMRPKPGLRRRKKKMDQAGMKWGRPLETAKGPSAKEALVGAVDTKGKF